MAGKDYGYGSRPDGTPKGRGFFRELKRPDGGISTELTATVPLGSQDVDVPLLVPTLSKKEVNDLLSVPADKKPWDVLPNYGEIQNKAAIHALERMKQDRPVFADEADELTPLPKK